jgi:hypothetical protein
MIDPWGIKKMVWSGEIQWSFPHCELLCDTMVLFDQSTRHNYLKDIRGLVNAGGEL